jgi:hypothetical protein
MAMHFSLLLLVISATRLVHSQCIMLASVFPLWLPLALFSSALAIDNCKCQDDLGQYNDATRFCCAIQMHNQYSGWNDIHYPGGNDQVSLMLHALPLSWNFNIAIVRK